MRIIECHKIDRESWRAFVNSHPKGNVFQTPEMYDVYALSDHIKSLAIAAADCGKIVGVLVAQYITNGNTIASWFTARSIITGGPLAKDDNPEIIKELLAAYKKQLPIPTIYTEIRPIYEMPELNSEFLQNIGLKRKGHYNLVLSLNKPIDDLFEQMHKERRRNVNQAIKAGLVFRELDTPEEIHKVVKLIEITYQRKHVPISYLGIFEDVRRMMSDYAHFFGCYITEGQMIAGEVRLCYKNLVYAWFAGSDENYFKLRPNDFTMWNVICWSREHGYELFDFGGGGEPGVPYGVRDYKLKYGCEMYDWGRWTLVHRPVAMWAGTIAYKLYHKLKGK